MQSRPKVPGQQHLPKSTRPGSMLTLLDPGSHISRVSENSAPILNGPKAAFLLDLLPRGKSPVPSPLLLAQDCLVGSAMPGTLQSSGHSEGHSWVPLVLQGGLEGWWVAWGGDTGVDLGLPQVRPTGSGVELLRPLSARSTAVDSGTGGQPGDTTGPLGQASSSQIPFSLQDCGAVA